VNFRCGSSQENGWPLGSLLLRRLVDRVRRIPTAPLLVTRADARHDIDLGSFDTQLFSSLFHLDGNARRFPAIQRTDGCPICFDRVLCDASCSSGTL